MTKRIRHESKYDVEKTSPEKIEEELVGGNYDSEFEEIKHHIISNLDLVILGIMGMIALMMLFYLLVQYWVYIFAAAFGFVLVVFDV